MPLFPNKQGVIMSDDNKELIKFLLGILGFLLMCIASIYIAGGPEKTKGIMLFIGIVGFFLSLYSYGR
jgi:hypothetical protein